MTRFIGAVFLLNAIFSCACVLLSGFKVTSTMFSSVSEIVFAISVVVLLINNKNKIIRSIGYIVLCVYFFIYTPPLCVGEATMTINMWSLLLL